MQRVAVQHVRNHNTTLRYQLLEGSKLMLDEGCSEVGGIPCSEVIYLTLLEALEDKPTTLEMKCRCDDRVTIDGVSIGKCNDQRCIFDGVRAEQIGDFGGPKMRAARCQMSMSMFAVWYWRRVEMSTEAARRHDH